MTNLFGRFKLPICPVFEMVHMDLRQINLGSKTHDPAEEIESVADQLLELVLRTSCADSRILELTKTLEET